MPTPRMPLQYPVMGYKISMVGSTLKNMSNYNKWRQVLLRTLDNIGTEIQNEIRSIIESGIFENPSGRGSQNILKEMDASTMRVRVYVAEDAFYLFYQEVGVEAQPMLWLLYDRIKKKIPFVIVNDKFQWAGKGSPYYDNKDVKFAKVTADDLAQGKWHHPGMEGKFFFRRGVEQALERVSDMLAGKFIVEVAKD